MSKQHHPSPKCLTPYKPASSSWLSFPNSSISPTTPMRSAVFAWKSTISQWQNNTCPTCRRILFAVPNAEEEDDAEDEVLTEEEVFDLIEIESGLTHDTFPRVNIVGVTTAQIHEVVPEAREYLREIRGIGGVPQPNETALLDDTIIGQHLGAMGNFLFGHAFVMHRSYTRNFLCYGTAAMAKKWTTSSSPTLTDRLRQEIWSTLWSMCSSSALPRIRDGTCSMQCYSDRPGGWTLWGGILGRQYEARRVLDRDLGVGSWCCLEIGVPSIDSALCIANAFLILSVEEQALSDLAT
ncbi:hypothetical protein BDY17DRAFT_302410 [Neohortaea acidophila]|uniref:Uncharacterized protein n=1 Tax=Neohortaea acidophila TaxID=245834 RepID=A0A6A6PL62_9PEZI|nr:uncharacterized protein BDY17DRAFT_302410 [Neohortaea acidophila]KAF2480800.1 hypothetical protein BDY17DRAFT_302410 [Neohortaea acidophila]